MSITCAALMCHAPIVIPAIGRERASECADTTRAMRAAARALVEHAPSTLVLISPHSPRDRTRWGIAQSDSLSGSFARFGHGRVRVSVKGAPQAARTLALIAAERGLSTRWLELEELDHGALVPLYFVHEAGYRGSVLLIALPHPNGGTEVRFGEAIRAAARASEERWAILASGDMSHRLTPDAPAGYGPEGRAFDEAFVARLRRSDVRGAIELPPELVAGAAEDVVQSTAVAGGAVGFDALSVRLLGYEGPFGVGYCEALLYEQHRAEVAPELLAQVALSAIEAQLSEKSFHVPTLDPPWASARPVFVTLRAPSGELRGCIGRTSPLAPTLAEEVADCAVGAATRDHRVRPIDSSELATLRLEVSILRPRERVERLDQLDPKRYGIVVSSGFRHAVLLPGIDAIESVEQQLTVALRKAGIPADAPYELARFAVDKVARRFE